MPRRGSPLNINPALNKPTTKFGVDYRFLAVVFFFSVIVFVFGAQILSFVLLPTLIAAGALLNKRDPQMFALWLLSFRLRSYYDPGKS